MNAPRKASLAVLAGVAITGVVGAAAASLGGLDTDSLGSDDAIVAACHDHDVPIEVAFTTSHDGDSFVVDTVVFSGVHVDCDDLPFTVVLDDGADGVQATGDAASPSFSANFGDIAAEDVVGVSLVIAG